MVCLVGEIKFDPMRQISVSRVFAGKAGRRVGFTR